MDGTCEPRNASAMLAEGQRWAGENGLNPDVIEEVSRTLISHLVDREMRHRRKTR